MFCASSIRQAVLILTIMGVTTCAISQTGGQQFLWLQAALAEPAVTQTQLPVSKTISLKALEKYTSISVTVEEEGKEVKYTGVPLRTLLSEMIPELKLDTMPGWKALSRQELVMEVKGDDGYPGLVPAIDVAINKSGDRFVLATHKDGKPIEAGVHLICKMDEARTRWVRQAVSVRVVALPK
jgi:hypothetical protein